jgi:hypothetical protein
MRPDDSEAAATLSHVQVTILGVTLIIDLAPDQPGLRDVHGAATITGESLYVFPTKRAA